MPPKRDIGTLVGGDSLFEILQRLDGIFVFVVGARELEADICFQELIKTSSVSLLVGWHICFRTYVSVMANTFNEENA
jgi:hypothetical protein